MKAIVTGGAGFIGSHIAEKLLEMDIEVVIIDNLSSGKKENIPEGARFVEGDVCDTFGYISHEFENTDVVFHNAASKKNICLRDPQHDLRVNGGGTLNILQMAVRHKVDKFIHASTGSVYGIVVGEITEDTPQNPVSYYGISKSAGENYVKHFGRVHGLNTTVLRYFHVYGKRQEDDPELGGVVAIFKKQIAEGKGIIIHGSGEQQRLFTHVEDVVQANIKAWTHPASVGEVYNCVAPTVITINQLARRLGAELIEYRDPLPGDIFKFEVSAEKIKRLGVKFRSFNAKHI
jgi:nucleoside-diphosphate-sugar epimerase